MTSTSINKKKEGSLAPTPSEIIALEKKGYILSKKIGQGSYATVHLADYTEGTRRVKLACKVFDKERAPKDFLDKFFPRELEILTKIDNAHLIQVHSILQRGLRVFIFMRYAENGDMLEFIRTQGMVPERQAKIWFRQLVHGVQYLHSKDLAHRDLKCENILLSRHWNIKIADFGFARSCVNEDGRRVMSHTYCGSAAYAAPEVVSGTPYNPKISDVWSMGIILFIMVNATMPFDDSNLKKLLRDQMARKINFRTKLKDMLSANFIYLIRALLEPDVNRRVTLDRLATNEWVRREPNESINASASTNLSVTHPNSTIERTRYER